MATRGGRDPLGATETTIKVDPGKAPNAATRAARGMMGYLLSISTVARRNTWCGSAESSVAITNAGNGDCLRTMTLQIRPQHHVRLPSLRVGKTFKDLGSRRSLMLPRLRFLSSAMGGVKVIWELVKNVHLAEVYVGKGRRHSEMDSVGQGDTIRVWKRQAVAPAGPSREPDVTPVSQEPPQQLADSESEMEMESRPKHVEKKQQKTPC